MNGQAAGARLISALMVAATIVGCGAKQLAYSPVFTLSIDEARSTVRRGFEEQQPPYRPTSVEVTDEKIDLVFHRIRSKKVLFVTAGTVSVPEPKTLYFDDLGKTDLFYKNGRYFVRIWDRTGQFRFWLVFPELPSAERFADAVAVLEKAFVK